MQGLLEAARLADPSNGDVVQALQETRRERIKHVSGWTLIERERVRECVCRGGGLEKCEIND